ncbi:signal peptidase I [Treponema sp. OMZ 840]|uniref:signal peptidase I n=1 Tax=Treponema sp. OMZ 840 TaxID=244313 RepID=UPI003D8F72F4
MKKIVRILNTKVLILCALFSILQIIFDFRITLDVWGVCAFILTAVFTIFLVRETSLFFKGRHVKRYFVIHKLYQYLPFVLLAGFIIRRSGDKTASLSYDIVAVIVWAAASLCVLCLLYFFNPKRFFVQNKDYADEALCMGLTDKAGKLVPKKRRGIQKVLFEILDWTDAIVQAVCTVVLINIFIFQLYVIPSESMVPEFLIGDRVIGFKTASGPRFPVSDAGLPVMRTYNRGDIVIFRNPRYPQDNKSEVKTFLSQLVLMFTFTKVNLNVDENGNIKADPLVKRITGVPGEQLVMQDGVLYRRTASQKEFTPVEEENLWAQWNNASLPDPIRKKVQYIPLTNDQYKGMLDIEKTRRGLDYKEAAREAHELSRRFSEYKKLLSAFSFSATQTSGLVPEHMMNALAFFKQSDTLIRKLLMFSGGELWFDAFMTDWEKAFEKAAAEAQKNGAADKPVLIGGDIYSDAMFRQNLVIKLNFGRLAVRTAELIRQGVSASEQNRDPERLRLLNDFQNAVFYLVSINDMRNMPVFPANTAEGEPSYIPPNNFFMMGDNRFNSLDMRHLLESRKVPLTAFDSHTLYYDSNMQPQYVPQKNILGTPILRFFPPKRFGVPGKIRKG